MNKSLRRRQILHSARRVFSEKGYHAASVEDIIKAAGVSRGTFYKHFKSKREVFGELVDGLTKALDMNIRRVDTSTNAPSVTEQMFENAKRILSILINNLDLTKILLKSATGIDPDFDRRLGEFYDSILALIQLSLKHGREMGIIRRECDEEVASYAILGSVKQAMEVFLNSKIKRKSPENLGKSLLDIFANGLFIR